MPPDRHAHGPGPPEPGSDVDAVHTRHLLGWQCGSGIALPSMMPSSPPGGLPRAGFESQFDLNPVEATPGIEPGIAVLQIPRIRPGGSANVRPEIKNRTCRPLTCAGGRRSPPGLGSRFGVSWEATPRPWLEALSLATSRPLVSSL